MRFKAELTSHFLNKSQSESLPVLAQQIFDAKITDLTYRTILSYLGTIRREQSKIIVENTPEWKVENGNYIFEKRSKTKVLNVQLVDQIFLYYSRRGYNFTRSAVQQRFKFSPRAFHDIQSVFHLSKDSDIISPYTKQNLNKEELEALLANLQAEIIDSGELTTQKHNQILEQKYRAIVEGDKKEHLWRDSIISEILDQNFTAIKLLVTDTPKQPMYKEMDWNITDLHAGSKSEKMLITADWSIERLEKMLDDAAKTINSYQCPKIHLNFLGDLVETVSGLNHQDSWKLIENGHFGSKTITKAFEILCTFISKVHNIYSINGVGGNHDRLQASNSNADTGATDLIFYMLSMHLKDSGILVNYDPRVLAFEREGYGVILGHGDKGIHKRKLADQILLFAINPKQFQFVNLGHLHTYTTIDSQHIGRISINPSLITGNYWSDVELGKGDLSGITANCVNQHAKPVQIVENL